MSSVELFMGNCLEDKSPGDNCPWENFIGDNCPGDSYSGGNYSGVIVRRAKVCGVIVLGEFHGEQLPGGQLSRRELVRGNFPGDKSSGCNSPRKNFMVGICPGEMSGYHYIIRKEKFSMGHSLKVLFYYTQTLSFFV